MRARRGEKHSNAALGNRVAVSLMASNLVPVLTASAAKASPPPPSASHAEAGDGLASLQPSVAARQEEGDGDHQQDSLQNGCDSRDPAHAEESDERQAGASHVKGGSYAEQPVMPEPHVGVDRQELELT